MHGEIIVQWYKILGPIVVAFLVLAAAVAFVGQATASPDRTQTLRLATTTSMQDSGLLDAILPGFEKANNVDVKVIAVGSGAAMKMGETGDADVLIAHSPAAEDAFIYEVRLRVSTKLL